MEVFFHGYGAEAEAKEEHHFCHGGLEGDVVSGNYTGSTEQVAGLITVGVDASVDALGHVNDNNASLYGIAYGSDYRR